MDREDRYITYDLSGSYCASESVATNFEQTLATYSSDAVRKAL